MSWVNELIDLYEINSDKIGVIEYRRDMPYVLLPPFHTTVTAQITVTIDQDGNFINAELVDLNDKLTIIPVTEKSGSLKCIFSVSPCHFHDHPPSALRACDCC